MISNWACGIGKPVGYYHDQIIKNFEEFKQLLKGSHRPIKVISTGNRYAVGQNNSIRREQDDCKKLVYIFNIDNSLAITTPDMEEILQKLYHDFKKKR